MCMMQLENCKFYFMYPTALKSLVIDVGWQNNIVHNMTQGYLVNKSGYFILLCRVLHVNFSYILHMTSNMYSHKL